MSQSVIPFYPWSEGDHLYASALNAAIRNSVSLGGNNKDFRTAYDFGAQGVVGGVPTDDTAALNRAFSQTASEGGGRIYFPDTFYAAGALTVPPGVEIYGNFTPVVTPSGDMTAPSYFQAGGSKLILGPSGMSLGSGCILRNIMVISHGLPATNPTTPAAAATMLAAMAANGTAITLTGNCCLIDTVQVLGFNYGIYTTTVGMNQLMLRRVCGDNINCIHLANGGDTAHIIGAHFWPYLSQAVPGGSTGAAWLQRSGDGIYTSKSGCNVQIAQCVVFGWQRCFVADADSVYWSQCWSDGNAPQSAGFASVGACGILQMSGCTAVANQFAVHHSPSNGAVFNIDSGSSLTAGGPGGSTPATGLQCCVLADGHGPVQCIGANFGGGGCGIYLGPNSGPSTIIGNQFDDALAAWGYIYNVDAAVVPQLTKHSNRVINSTRGLTEILPVNQATGNPLYDSFQNQFTGLSMYGSLGLASAAGSTLTPSVEWLSAGSPTDEKVWDIQAGGSALAFRALNDTATASTTYLNIVRTGYTSFAVGINGALNVTGPVGFNGHGALPLPTVGGAKGGNTALASLLSVLVAYGLILDSTTA